MCEEVENKEKNSEKRKRKRLQEITKVTLEILSHDNALDEENVYHSLIQDISLTGARILTTRKVPVNATVKMNIWLSNPNRPVSVIGKVKWAKNIEDENMFEEGLEFDETRPHVIAALIGHIYKKRDR